MNIIVFISFMFYKFALFIIVAILVNVVISVSIAIFGS